MSSFEKFISRHERITEPRFEYDTTQSKALLKLPNGTILHLFNLTRKIDLPFIHYIAQDDTDALYTVTVIHENIADYDDIVKVTKDTEVLYEVPKH
jgi:hypothetical protein